MIVGENNVLEAAKFMTWKDDQGIVKTKVKPFSEVGLQDAIENSELVNSFEPESHQAGYPLLVDLRQLKSISKEARKHFSMKGRESKVIAIAMLVESNLSRRAANFYLSLNKPKVPVKLFNEEVKAEEWCLDFLSE